MVVRRFQRESHGGGQGRLALASLARAQPLYGQSERAAEGELALELASLVGVAREQ